MPDLEQALAQIRDRLTRYEGEGINEQNTKATLIAPLLRALGWDVEDLEEVHREYRHHPSDNPVDYALLDLRTPRLLVEAKALGRDLSDRKWANQIMGYASVAGVEWVVLTNGNEYRIYNAHASVPVEEKLFRAVRLTNDDPQLRETLVLLSKPALQENHLKAHWQAQFVDRQVQAALRDLFAPEPDASLVRLLKRRITDLSSRHIEESLRRVRPRFDFPVEPIGEPPPSASTRKERPQPSRRTQLRKLVTIADLVAAGIIQPPLELHKTHKGQHLTARVEANGTITVNGQPCTSPSTAGGVAAMAAGTRKLAPGEKLPHIDGWNFWQFTDADDQSKPIDALRQRYVAERPSNGS